MSKMKVHRIQAQEVQAGDHLLTESGPIGGYLVSASYELGKGRWALDIPGMQQMMQFDRTDQVIVIRKEKF